MAEGGKTCRCFQNRQWEEKEDIWPNKNTIVFGLRARHFQTSTSFFLVKKTPLFQYGKHFQIFAILYPKTCATNNMSDSL